MQCPAVNAYTQCLDADIVDVMGFVKYHDAVLAQVLGHEVADLGVQHILVIIHHDVGDGDQMTRQKVRTPLLRTTQLLEVVQRVDALQSVLGAQSLES